MKTTKDGRPAGRKCSEVCTGAKPHTDCDCRCGYACHGMGDCDLERHVYDANNFLRLPRIR